MRLSLDEVARRVGGEVIGPRGAGQRAITGVASLAQAREGEITFIAAAQYEQHLDTTRASAVLVTPSLAQARAAGQAPDAPALVQVADPHRAFVQLLGLYEAEANRLAPGIHPTAVVAASAIVHPAARVGAYVVMGERVRLDADVEIWPHVVLGEDVRVGEGSRLHPHVTVHAGCVLGERVVVHPGTVVGGEPAAFRPGSNGPRASDPQAGIVRIADDVEIGANSLVDRALTGETVLERGAKIDNLVHVARGVRLGPDTCVAAQCCLGPDARLGARNLFAGQVVVAADAATGDDVIVLAQGWVAGDLPRPGLYGGVPAAERIVARRALAAELRLPKTIGDLEDLELRVQNLETRQGTG